MKATSTVRRIDNLGRIVIPKEVRRTLRIRDGDPLEIFVAHEGEVVLKKYSHINELEDLAQEYAESLAAVLGHIALISDREQIVAVAGWPRKYFFQKRIGSAVIEAMEERKAVLFSQPDQQAGYKIFREGEGECRYSQVVIAPIITDSEPMGAVILASGRPGVEFSELELKSALTAASILAKQM
ncbi:MAG TPA: AbrB/MazE/SpoVT family DNA-binding domain-containing protein [Firmicutes bacterium]|jgi:AbrB family transcriptional regulator (stage V sporulation protein T)|nr:AbrB/MazE/SpoVT family DNA-binding domain-containing protein [Bacillota bacterium]